MIQCLHQRRRSGQRLVVEIPVELECIGLPAAELDCTGFPVVELECTGFLAVELVCTELLAAELDCTELPAAELERTADIVLPAGSTVAEIDSESAFESE